MVGVLPKTVDVGGVSCAIRTDFRDILRILCAFNDPELEDEEKVYVCLVIFYENFEDIPEKDYEDAFRKALRFMDAGQAEGGKPAARVMDWEQDEALIFPAVNKVAGFETRAREYIHWWTFVGYYMEISEGVFSHVLDMRMKRAKGKKLEKWEREYWNANKQICVLKPKLTEKEQEEKDRLNALLG